MLPTSTSSMFAKSIRLGIDSHERLLLATILLAGLLIRLPFALIDFHVGVDLQIFMDWGQKIHLGGLQNIYNSGNVNYPPLLLYLFGAAAWIEAQLPPSIGAHPLVALIKLPSVIADMLTACLIALVWWRISAREALLATALYLFNPAIWYISAYWGQTDSIYALFLCAAVVALDRNRTLTAWVAYALALATKPQSLSLAFLLIIWTLILRKPRDWLIATMGVAITGAILISPWLLAGQLGDVIQTYATLPNQAPRVDVSAYDLWYLLRLGRVHNLSSELHPLGGPVSYQTIGIVLFGSFAAVVAALGVVRRNFFLTAATLALGAFMLLTQVHERYLFPTLALLALASISQPRLWFMYGLLTLTFLYNLITIAPFTPLLGSNLIAWQDPASIVPPWAALLQGLSLGAAGLNILALAWLVVELARTRIVLDSGQRAG